MSDGSPALRLVRAMSERDDDLAIRLVYGVPAETDRPQRSGVNAQPDSVSANGSATMTAPTQSNPSYLEVNIPRIGRVEALMYFAEKPSTKKPGTMMPAQFGFKGTWRMDGGEVWAGMVYVDEYKLDTNLLTTGFANRAADYQGQPRYEWLERGEVQLVLRLLPHNKRAVYVSRLAETAPAAAGAAPAPPQAGPTHAQAPATTGYQAARAPQAAPVSAPPSNAADPWAAMERTYARAQVIAMRAWGDDYDQQALVAATAAIWIEANKKGITAGPLADTFREMPAPLTQGFDNDNRPGY